MTTKQKVCNKALYYSLLKTYLSPLLRIFNGCFAFEGMNYAVLIALADFVPGVFKS